MQCKNCGGELPAETDRCYFCGLQLHRRRLTKEEKAIRQRMRNRQVRRAKVLLAAGVGALCLIVTALIYFYAFFSYATIDMKDCVIVQYSGYHSNGSITVTMNQDKIKKILDNAYSRYLVVPVHFQKHAQAEYESLYDSIECVADKTENLHNGDEITISFHYNEKLADQLKVECLAKEQKIVIDNLPEAQVVSQDDLFGIIDVKMTGTSPEISAEIVKNTQDSFLQSVLFSVEPSKLYYQEGDTITVKASWDEAAAVKSNIKIDADQADCSKTYYIEGFDQYLSAANQIPDEMIEEANTAGKAIFKEANANEYGQRIYTEAGIVVDWTGGKTSFVWSNPVLISAYFKSIKDEVVGTQGLDYNDLDFIYYVTLSQGDGQSCKAEVAVRVDNLLKKADGTYEMDLDNVEIVSASYNDRSIVQNIITKYEDNYNIEKLEHTEYY